MSTMMYTLNVSMPQHSVIQIVVVDAPLSIMSRATAPFVLRMLVMSPFLARKLHVVRQAKSVETFRKTSVDSAGGVTGVTCVSPAEDLKVVQRAQTVRKVGVQTRSRRASRITVNNGERVVASPVCVHNDPITEFSSLLAGVAVADPSPGDKAVGCLPHESGIEGVSTESGLDTGNVNNVQGEAVASHDNIFASDHVFKALAVPYWEAMLSHSIPDSEAHDLVDGLVNGVRIGRPPARGVTESPNWPSSYDLSNEVSEVIGNDLELGRLYGPFDEAPFDNYIVSPLGAFLKRGSSKARVIHDLSYPAVGSVNSMIDPEEYSLQYSSIDDAVELCRNLGPGVPWLAKVDLKDAFKHIAVHPDDWHLMGFRWPDADGRQKVYFNKVLSFGLRSAPSLFDSYAKFLPGFAAKEGLRSSLVRYVDDFLIVSPELGQCEADIQILVDTCRKAGFTIQASKVTEPLKVVQFLGIEIDVVHSQLRISDERMSEVKGLLDDWIGRRSCTKRQLLKLVGKLAFAARVVRKGRAFLGRLIELSKRMKFLHYRTRLSVEARADIDWWRRSLESHNGVALIGRSWSDLDVTHVYTDASDYGCGAVCFDEWFAVAYISKFAGCRDRSINWREMHVAVMALATWGPRWANSSVIFHVDNQATCGVLSKLYTPCPDLMRMVRQWALLLEQYNIEVRVEYISTHDNVLADVLSRGSISQFRQLHPHASAMVWPSEIVPECANLFPF